MKKLCSLNRRWTDDDYARLLDLAQSICSFFIVIERKKLTEHGKMLLDTLRPFLVHSRKVDSWPGTELCTTEGNGENLYKYQLVAATATILSEAREILFWPHFDWNNSTGIEDLCFLRKDSTPWFGSITHENDAFFILSEEEKQVVENHFGRNSLQQDSPDGPLAECYSKSY